MENSKIEWTEHTFNPWIGCTEISDACTNCYARVLSARTFKVKWGAGEQRKRTSEAYWKQPLKWNADAAKSGVRPRIFCASLADVFDNEVDPQWRADLFDLIRKTPNLDWMILTKRIGNISKLLRETIVIATATGNEKLAHALEQLFDAEPIPNIHLGVTVCNQVEFDRDYVKLACFPAAKRFISFEPLLGPISFGGWPLYDQYGNRTLDLVIAGGESGPKARPSHPDWFRSLRDQCASADVQFMFKQWGEYGPIPEAMLQINRNFRKDDPYRFGKKSAGRLLDGVEHNGVIT